MSGFPFSGAADRRDEERMASEFVAQTSDGLENVYRAYAHVLYSVARHVLRNDEDAQDCLHDALLRAWQRGAYRPERGPLRAYLLVCVRNEAIARKRNDVRHARSEENAARSDGLTYEFDAGDAVERGRLRDAIATLPPEQREALALAYVGHLSHLEMARRLDVPLGTVKGRLRLALGKLHAVLQPRDRDAEQA